MDFGLMVDGYWRFVGWGRRCKRTRDEKRKKDEEWHWVTVARQRKKHCRNRNARRRRTVVSIDQQDVLTFGVESSNKSFEPQIETPTPIYPMMDGGLFFLEDHGDP